MKQPTELTAHINPHEHGFVWIMQTLIPANINELTVAGSVYRNKIYSDITLMNRMFFPSFVAWGATSWIDYGIVSTWVSI